MVLDLKVRQANIFNKVKIGRPRPGFLLHNYQHIIDDLTDIVELEWYGAARQNEMQIIIADK